jgi:hypothetical protein
LLDSAVLDLLEQRPARFVSEVIAALQHVSLDEVERALTNLDAEGKIIIREGYCADPHLGDMDLRMVGVIGPPKDDSDSQARAIAAIDNIWTAWLGDYLSNHRCG